MKKIIYLILVSLFITPVLAVEGIGEVTTEKLNDNYYKVTASTTDFNVHKVRFWFYEGNDTKGKVTFRSQQIDTENNGTHETAVYYAILNGQYTIKAKFKTDTYSFWSENVTVPLFSNMIIVLVGCVGAITLIKKRKK